MTSHGLADSPVWTALTDHARVMTDRPMRALFVEDANRFAHFSRRLGPLLVDYSKHRINSETLPLLMALAQARDIEGGRAAMFAGQKINVTEDRAVLHTALRNLSTRAVTVDGKDVMPDVRDVRTKLKAFSEAVRGGARKGATGEQIRHIVNIGIGGSHLGPMFVAEALRDHQRADLTVDFVSNPDRTQIDDVLRRLDPAATLFVVASKTFTTVETMANANIARAWISANLGDAAVKHHFAAISTNLKAIAAFGIDPDAVFPMWDWVGGRYSLWSAIGLSVILAVGYDVFERMLAGAETMDRHFQEAPLSENLPVILAMLGIWYTDFFGAAAQAILPYDHRLRLLPAHLQQVDMESNGKGVAVDGTPILSSGPIVFGGGGSDSQHSFYQLLHQGPRLIPCDFIVALTGGDQASRELLLANAFAQTEALMRGRPLGEVTGTADALKPHRAFSGNRPSTTIVLDAVTPESLGMLIALYEHKVFVQGLIWGIDSFDQWGVELGKELATNLMPALQGKDPEAAKDSSTAGLVAAYRKAART
jgi:glucose-6-phosphate isomerase